jgi:hypothetical protein
MVIEGCEDHTIQGHQWCYSGAPVVSQWCHSGVTVVSQWWHSGVTVVS